MLRPLHIALLELKLFVNNRGELAFGVALPILLFALMYGALSSESEFHTPASVVDLDGGPQARELVERLDALPEISVEERTEAEADGALERSAILFAVVVPAGFSDALEAGEPIPLVFRQRGSGGGNRPDCGRRRPGHHPRYGDGSAGAALHAPGPSRFRHNPGSHRGRGREATGPTAGQPAGGRWKSGGPARMQPRTTGITA